MYMSLSLTTQKVQIQNAESTEPSGISPFAHPVYHTILWSVSHPTPRRVGSWDVRSRRECAQENIELDGVHVILISST